MNKDERLVMLITTEMKERIRVEAEKQAINEPKYVRQAIDFYSAFDVHFLEKIYSTAESQKISMPLAIELLLTSYLAQDYAFLEVFGMPTNAFKRAFQHDEKGLIEGNDLSALVLQQTKQDIAGLREKLIESVKTGTAARITKEEASILGAGRAARMAGDHVKPEYTPKPVARAKSK